MGDISDKITYSLAKSEFRQNRAEFYEDLAEALKDNGELAPTIQEYANRYAGRPKDRGLSMIFSEWLRRMDSVKFSEAISGTVPEMDVMVLSSMEQAGELANGLTFLAESVRIVDLMKEIMRKALIYPIIIILAVSAILVIFSIFLIPNLEMIYTHDKWPIFGKIFYGMSRVVMVGGPYLAIAAVLGVIGLVRSFPRWTGGRRDWWDKHVPYSIYRDYAGGVFLVTLASLCNSGLSLGEALEKIKSTASPWLTDHINRILRKMDEIPDQPGKALNTGIFSVRLADRIESFAKRGGGAFGMALSKVGIQGVHKVIKGVELSSTVLNKGLMILGGILLLLVVLGVGTVSMNADEALKAQVRNIQPH